MPALSATLPADATVMAQRLASPDGQATLRALGRGLIVDMDDTLITNQVLFDYAADALAAVYATLDAQGRTASELKALHDRIDNDNIGAMGYTPERWYFSAQQAADLFAGRCLSDAERGRVREAADIAMGTGDLLDGVEDALSALAQAEVAMLLKTKGSLSKQTEKLDVHRFDRFFGDRIEIVDRKDADTFRRLTAAYRLPRAVSIGDSVRSDITPALEAGLDAVLIDKSHRASTWTYETGEHAAPTVASFPEAVCLVAGLRA